MNKFVVSQKRFKHIKKKDVENNMYGSQALLDESRKSANIENYKDSIGPQQSKLGLSMLKKSMSQNPQDSNIFSYGFDKYDSRIFQEASFQENKDVKKYLCYILC